MFGLTQYLICVFSKKHFYFKNHLLGAVVLILKQITSPDVFARSILVSDTLSNGGWKASLTGFF